MTRCLVCGVFGCQLYIFVCVCVFSPQCRRLESVYPPNGAPASDWQLVHNGAALTVFSSVSNALGNIRRCTHSQQSATPGTERAAPVRSIYMPDLTASIRFDTVGVWLCCIVQVSVNCGLLRSEQYREQYQYNKDKGPRTNQDKEEKGKTSLTIWYSRSLDLFYCLILH